MKAQSTSGKLLFLFLAVVLSIALITFRAEAQKQSVSLGGIFDLTSPSGSIWGNDERDGFILAVEDFRKANPSFEVTYAIEDSAYSNTRSVSALQKLMSVNKAKFIVGPTWETFVAISPICERNKIICFAPSNHGNIFHDLKNPLHYSFTAFFDERGYATILADKMIEDKRKRVAVFSTISAYFETLSQAFFDRFKEKPVFYERFEPAITDFRSVITRTPKDIDSLFLILAGTGQNNLFLTQWLQLRSDKPIIYSHDGIIYEPNWENIKKMGFSFQISKPYLEPSLEQGWSERVKVRFGKTPGAPTGSISYDETMILLNCIKLEGNDTEKVRNCIASTNDYHGLSGNLSFNGGQAVTTGVYTIEKVSS